MPLDQFARWVSKETGVSIVIAQTLDRRLVNVDVQEQPVDDVLAAVARRVGVQVSRTGTLYFLGELRPEDRGVLVRRIYRLDGNGIQEAVEVLLSEHGTVKAFDDGLLIVGDTVEVLQRVHELVDRVEKIPSVTWVIQLYVVSLTDDAIKDLGIDVQPAAQIGLTYAAKSAALAEIAPSEKLAIDAGLKAILTAQSENVGIDVVGEPLMILADGQPGEIKQGQKVPVPKRTVSDTGVVTTSGFEYIDIGMNIRMKMKEISLDVGRLDLDFELSQIDDLIGVEQVPLTSQQVVRMVTDVASGGVYLLAKLEEDKNEMRYSRYLKFGKYDRKNDRTLQVWGRVYRIGLNRESVGETH